MRGFFNIALAIAVKHISQFAKHERENKEITKRNKNNDLKGKEEKIRYKKIKINIKKRYTYSLPLSTTQLHTPSHGLDQLRHVGMTRAEARVGVHDAHDGPREGVLAVPERFDEHFP